MTQLEAEIGLTWYKILESESGERRKKKEGEEDSEGEREVEVPGGKD